ncbi:MAG: septal ring lytic transglycosylase RlpA family protein [Sphaerochaetaceae bacterium]|nr:septal ring lytic transglycosylase RlpA family protein [Sphaerochaetaceae bacterium]NLO60128.1 septal ring lytic transglycosylase RlpA family protein [Spirochaetales bacterium]MDD2406097.1 septal ring lytic transglycosylase RlpA family protein [Sphaerochaetaceae bacterium]MDD3670075.1 septal ring lytic transglycosylase RlpA family protein [Sphaerochaetaceae bacterium]MDD4260243.1 septal ring lytic transglycosylase RlpA family protein [Sphaerochaetaceae bacterium]
MRALQHWKRVALIVIVSLCVFLQLISAGPIYFEEGIASWYTSDEPEALTANGEIFDPTAIAAAHKTLKFGTIVRVHNTLNETYVDVRIFDRGPYVEGRIIDLTPAAAEAIDMLKKGIAPVKLEIIYEPQFPDSRYDRPGDTGWFRLQLGSFSSVTSVYNLYRILINNSFKVGIEIVESSFIRIHVRWIHETELDNSLEKLASLGFNDILKRSEIPPSP